MFIDLFCFIKSYIKCPFVVVLRKWHLFVQKKKIAFFKIQNLDFLKKSHFKGILELKTVYFAYKPILDSLC